MGLRPNFPVIYPIVGKANISNILKSDESMNESMGSIRSLILGAKSEDVDGLWERYGPPPSQHITLSNGENIHLRDEGDPKAFPIVLLHGHSEDLHTWDQFVKHLVEGYRVVRFDLRRHGLTGPASDDQYGIESYVSDLSFVVEHLGIDNFDLAGHSMGGRIAVKYSMENPDKVRNLILLAASGTPRGKEGSPPLAMKLMKNHLGRFLIKRMWSRKMAKDTLIDMVHDGSLITDEEVNRMWEYSRYPGSMDAMFREFGMVWDDFTPIEIEKITTNTLLIWGEEDTICPVEMGIWYNSHLPNSTLIRLPEIGHNPQFECPEVCLDEISSWLGTY